MRTQNRRRVVQGGRNPDPPQTPPDGDRVPVDWRDRFIRAYDTELQEWLNAVAAGSSTGPTSWDGFAAAVVTDAALEALRTGQRTAVSMPERPEFYAK